ncbi:MAG: outer membrane lipoprotein-sorting protein [Candidatus Protistobacter heckmanni]|nr:outer membrane lipoprotein-sorting protein [Candidatus Protistobacter heckmanni]
MNTLRTFKNAVMAAGLAMVTVLPAAQAAEPDAMQLLKSSDQARGGGYAGLVWEIQVTNTGSGAEDQPNQKLRIKAVDTASVAEVLDPPNTKGSRMLQVDRNMWMTKPGLKKPVAIGDIAATNYAKDYSAKYLRQEDVGGEPCHVLDLSANNRQTTYDRITYWVSAKRGLAVKAEFLSLSGKKLKSADFEYGNSIVANGKTIPFVSKMTIADALTDARTTLQYTRIKVQAVPASEFDVGNLQ